MERGSLTVRCRYDPEWETYRKWWCRGAAWGSCRILVQTTESEWEMRKGRVSIVDSQGSHVFFVTMEELRPDDADVYWCGIARTGVDHGVSVKVTIRPGKSMCKCVCVSSGPALSWSLRSLCSDLTHSACIEF